MTSDFTQDPCYPKIGEAYRRCEAALNGTTYSVDSDPWTQTATHSFLDGSWPMILMVVAAVIITALVFKRKI